MMNISNETDAASIQRACNLMGLSQFYSLAPYDVALHVICILFGLPTHSYIVWLIVKGKRRGIESEFITLNLSICEIIFYLRSVNTVLSTVFTRLFPVRIFLTGFAATARFFQCLICVERYLAVVHPVIFLKLKPLRYRVACSVFIWIMIIIFCVISLELGYRRCLTYVYKSLYLLHHVAFLVINLFCCVAVLRALKKPRPGERVKEREEENRMKRRAFYIILTTTVTLIITYVPSSITTLQFTLSVPASRELESLSLTCFFLPGFVQPVLFIHRVGKLPFCKSP